jgi:hypothetical protein
LLVALLASALSAVPAGAAAEGAGAKPAPRTAQFTVAGSNGYAIAVTKKGNRVEVAVEKGPAPLAARSGGGGFGADDPNSYNRSTYTVTDTPDPDAINADLGVFGSIAVSFHPSGRHELAKAEDCAAAKGVRRELGSFEGTITFVGEGAYTSVGLTSAAGSVGGSPRPECRSGSAGAAGSASLAPSTDGTDLIASNLTDAGVVNFSAVSLGEMSRFSSHALATREGVSVIREAIVTAPSGTFTFPASFDHATVRPPAPFSGYGAYGRSKGWSGSLRVRFPGEVVALTGPTFRSKLIPPEPEESSGSGATPGSR